MPKSLTASYRSFAPSEDDDEYEHTYQYPSSSNDGLLTVPPSPTAVRRQGSTRTSDVDLRSRLPARLPLDEQASLLAHADTRSTYLSTPTTPRLSRLNSFNSVRRNHSRRGSFGAKLARALSANSGDIPQLASSSVFDDRVWYDQFTSTDWVHDSIADAFRVKELRSRRDFRGRLQAAFDGAQGWVLVAVIGCLTAGVAYLVDITEASIFDIKSGYCSTKWYHSKKKCCQGASVCEDWRRWSVLLRADHEENRWVDCVAFIFWAVLLSVLAHLVTLTTKTTISSAISLSTLDENLGAERRSADKHDKQDGSLSPTQRFSEAAKRPPLVYYPAAGSGVAEVKVINSGFVLHGYLGVKTLVAKTLGLVLAVASGLSLGKEGPYVHIAACIGNICCRMFSKYSHNDAKRREVLSASSASGVAVAFGAPIGGTLFSLEEVSYYFPPKTLFRTFFCCIVAALSLKALNPYGTNKIVLFEVRYLSDWKFFEMIIFILLGIMGGVTGALFIKASRFWAKTFRKIPTIKNYPVVEVVLVALLTGITSFWNRYTRLPVAELLFEVASPCDAYTDTGTGLCPTKENIPHVIWYLCVALVIKAALTTVTFGIKVPAGIYVPSMVIGGLMGRIVGHIVQWFTLEFPNTGIFGSCPAGGHPESCIVPGVYALVCAGATMCGVTRLSVTLAVILFELTGSLEHVLPFAIGVLVSKWTADALEPSSIYDLLTDMNAYPYLDSKFRPVFTNDLGDITSPPKPTRLIDISGRPLVPAYELRQKLEYMHMAGELDGGLPIVRDGILVGLIPGPDLEFALDRLGDEDGALCLMNPKNRYEHAAGNNTAIDGRSVDEETARPSTDIEPDLTDFTPFIDPAPMALDISSPMDLVFECFVKLGLRYICVLKEGRYAGLVHKKAFVKYVKELEATERKT